MGTGVPLDHARGGSLEASLIYAMEIHPYIEEPAPQPLSTLSLDAFDLTPRARHDFTLTSNESLENYWQTLEFFFSGAVPSVARRAFPGASVPEVGILFFSSSLEDLQIYSRFACSLLSSSFLLLLALCLPKS